MQNGLYSYLIPIKGDLWDSIHDAHSEVDCLPGYSLEMADILLDYLESECRIALPRPKTGKPMGTCAAIACMTSHEAQTLRTRIESISARPISEILTLYGKEGVGRNEWADFLCRQAAHFTSDDQRLVMVISTQTSSFEDAQL